MDNLRHIKERIQEYRIQKEQTRQDLYNFLAWFDNLSPAEKEEIIRAWEAKEKENKKHFNRILSHSHTPQLALWTATPGEEKTEIQEKWEIENMHDMSDRLLGTLSKRKIRSTKKLLATKWAVWENLKKALLAPNKIEEN